MVNCIAGLTKGYNNIENYSQLIKRNIHIDNNLIDKSVNILIFHEGNITDEQQIYIKEQTPNIKIIFVNISNISFHNSKKDILFEEAHEFNLGYRHMCSFWFINFFDAVKEYDKLLRIDEDCFIDSNIDRIFLELDQYIFISGIIAYDFDFVTKGLNNFTLDFMNKHKDFNFKTNLPQKPNGPYTNLFGMSLSKIWNNDIFHKYKNEVDISNMIYKRRWGDLPLWGEAITYIFDIKSLKIDNTIKYFHGSHNKYVN